VVCDHVDAHADRQRQHRGGREDRLSQQLPQGVPQVLEQVGHLQGDGLNWPMFHV